MLEVKVNDLVGYISRIFKDDGTNRRSPPPLPEFLVMRPRRSQRVHGHGPGRAAFVEPFDLVPLRAAVAVQDRLDLVRSDKFQRAGKGVAKVLFVECDRLLRLVLQRTQLVNLFPDSQLSSARGV